MFGDEPPLGAFLNQPYTYTVTFAPLDAAGTLDEGNTEGEDAAGDPTPEALPSEEPVTPPDTNEGAPAEATDGTTETESPESGSVATDEDATGENGDGGTEGEIAAAQLVESLPFAVAANGALTVEVPVRPRWLAPDHARQRRCCSGRHARRRR